jgi:hypothetical protein
MVSFLYDFKCPDAMTTRHADLAGSSKGSGSQLFMLNVHMWQYWRPQPRTISVGERHAKQAGARQVAGQKRERRRDVLQDRRARIRATKL